MSNIDIRNLITPQVGVQDASVATSTPTTVIGTVTPTIQNPFSVGYVAGSTSVDLPNGTSLKLPTLSQGDMQQVNALFGGMDETSLDKVHKASQRLAKALFAAVSQDDASDSTNSIFGSVGGAGSLGIAATGTGGAGTTGVTATGTGSVTSGSTATATTDTVSQRVDNLTSSLYQTLSQTQMNVQPQDGDNDDQDDDGSDDDTNSWGTTGSIPQMQNVQNLSATPQLQLTNTQTTAGATSSAAAVTSTQNKLQSSNSPTQAPLVSSGTPEVYSAAANAVQVYQQGATAAANANGSVSTGSLNYDGAVNAVTYMGIIGLQNQLTGYAEQTQTQLNQLNNARTEYEDVSTAVANWPAGQQTQHFDWTTYDSNGRATSHSADLTYDQATTLKSNLEDQVNGMSDTNQTQQLQLQQLTQDYQQAINTMSNLMKMNFDTVKAVINNIRA